MAWITTKDGKHINTDWFEKDKQIAQNKAEADDRNNKRPSTEDIDSAKVGTVFDNYGGLTKQSAYSDYHQSSSARNLNEALRDEKQLSDWQKTKVSVMDSKMQNITSPIQVDREVSPKYFNSLGFKIDPKSSVDTIVNNLQGKTFTDKGYASSSYKPHEAGRSNYGSYGVPIHLKINCPKGTPAYLTSNKSEHEITLGRGLTYKITSVQKQVTHNKLFNRDDVEIIAQVEIVRK